MNLKSMNELAVLSALMHDIGKFAQRAGQPHSENLESTYCPINAQDKNFSHKHLLYSHYYLDSDFFPLPNELQALRSKIACYASLHHKPGVSSMQSDLQAYLIEHIISHADCLSSGLDRIQNLEQEHDYKTAHLQSIFSHISLKKPHNDPSWHSLRPMGDYKAIFPCDKGKAEKSDYAQLFALFAKDIQSIPLNEGYWAYLSSLISQLEKYTYCIPSCTYKTEPDISLYDHSITTAAIAQALWHNAHDNDIKHEKDISKQKFYLFAAELSGIQKYIFTGKGGKGYTRILRARSFHLQALTRGIILNILHKLDLLPVAKIMDAGGKFILLLPATQKVTDRMKSIMQEIEYYFATSFQGELKMPMTLIPLSQEEMKQDRFIDKLDEVNDTLEQNKLQLFGQYFKEHSAVYDISFPDGVCPYCDRKPANKYFEDEKEKTCKICNECSELIDIGKALPPSKYGLFTKIPPKNGVRLKLINDMYFVLDSGNKFAPSEISAALDIINIKSHDKYTSYAIAGHIPNDDAGDSLCFEDMAKKAQIKDEKGINRCVPMLGVLKADVDNLGLTFSLGFKDKLSISRFANLSRMLNVFFSEHLVQVIQKNKLCIYTVFTGGDDLFILGSWTDIIKFASILHNDLAIFTGGNPNITLSAGLVLAKPKLPISNIAKMAEEDLKKSKKYPDKKGADKKSPDKNACTVFDITCSWQELEKQLEKGRWLEDEIINGKITQGLTRRLLTYAADCQDFIEEGKIKKGLYISHLKYDLARNVKDEDIKNEILAMADPAKPIQFKNSRIAISYALYKTRNQ